MPVIKEDDSLDTVDEMDSKKNAAAKTKETLLPLNRIRIIMKSSPETENIGQDALFLVARTTVSIRYLSICIPRQISRCVFTSYVNLQEFFVKYLTSKAYEQHKKDKLKVLDYPSLADSVQTMKSMAFLKGKQLIMTCVGFTE